MVTTKVRRVTYQRGDLNSTIDAARRLQSDKDLYLVPTAQGYTIEHRTPPPWQQHVIVHPDGRVSSVVTTATEQRSSLTKPDIGTRIKVRRKRHGDDVPRAHKRRAGGKGTPIRATMPPETIPRVKAKRGVEGILPTEGEGREEIRGKPYQERRVGGERLEPGYPLGDIGVRERLIKPEAEPLTPGILPTSEPKDIILDSTSDIGTNAGAVARFDANLEAIRTLKLLDAEDRKATPEEQAILAKYSGFGDSAFESAFRTHLRADDPWGQRGNRLRELTTEDEYRDLEQSRLNAFFTTPEVIGTIWKVLQQMGADEIAHPNILEPSAGSGRFLGFQPIEMAARSQRTAVELDQLTGRMLKHTYPQTDVYVMGFEQAPIAPESVDIAISNVPFGDYPVHDPTYTKARKLLTRQIHNYFFAKTLDKLRPGGMLAFVTSHYTMDSAKAKPIREALAEQADLVGAIRLPKSAFPDTEVVTDIIFMRKREPSDTPGDTSWIYSDPMELQWKSEYGYSRPVNVNVNRYFIENPEMVLGKHAASGSMYGGGEYTVEPLEGQSLTSLMSKSAVRLPNDIIKDAPTISMKRRAVYMPSSEGIREGSRVIGDDGKIYVKRAHTLQQADMSQVEQDRVKAMLAVRDAARDVLNAQLQDASNETVAEEQAELASAYNAFVTQHGALNMDRNADLMGDDPDGAFLRALEKWSDAKTKQHKGKTSITQEEADSIKMPIFTQRVVHGMGKREITTDADAVAVSLNETGRLDFQRMGELLGQSANEVRDSLAEKRLIFKNPIGDWEPADKYLSGDVREKLHVAKTAAGTKPVFKPNVEALEIVQPEDLMPGQIAVRLGSPWIPSEYVNDFVRDLLDTYYSYRGEPFFRYVEQTGEWVKGGRVDAPYSKLTSEFGTSRMAANDIIYRILNSKPVEVFDKIEDEGGEKSIRNMKETIAAQEKAAIIHDKFKAWLWDDPDRTKKLLDIYNNTFNTTRPRQYKGEHQELPGMSVVWAKQIHPHQKDAIWRIVQDRTALLAHEVGFGKTAVMVGSGMELRRLGLSQKNMYVVPKATHEQFVGQFKDVYPYASVLSPGDADFTPAKRPEFISRVVTGDWDAVILSDTQFQRIPVKPETEAKFLRDEINGFRAALEIEQEAMRSSYGRSSRKSATHKQLQKAIERLEVRLKDTMAKIGEKQQQAMYFEDLGVDQLFVDESDMYKNLRFATRMGRIKGLPNSDSERAWNMYQKCRYLQQQGKGAGVVFSTGTPVANTIAEMYTQMRYLQEPMLEAKGLQHFDAWAKTFGETTESLEQTPTGQYKLTQRFAKFSNTPELSNLWQNVADIRVADEVEAIVKQRPRLVNEQGQAKRIVVSCPPDQALLDYMKLLEQRADEVHGKDPRDDNMLKIASDARMASLDMRMVRANAPFNQNGKVATAAKKIAEIHGLTAGDKGTQLVFLDLGTPKAAEKVSDTGETEEYDETAQEEQVLRNVYRVLKERLIAEGIPDKEIAFIHEAKSHKQKRELFSRVNSGDIRVIIGSTGKLGTGVNVQERAAALHHLDAPWRPRDIEQREGRIIRQGNIVYGPKRDETGKIIDPGQGVRVYTYVTERSFDAFMWQAIEAKSKAIKSIMRRENPPRAVEDIDSFTMNAGEAKAIASGNPDIMRAVNLKNEVTKLQMLRASHTDARVRAKEQLQHIPREIEDLTSDIGKMEKDAKLAEKAEPFTIMIKSEKVTERPMAGESIKEAMEKSAVVDDANKAPEIAKYKGFSVRVFNQGPGDGYKLLLVNPETDVAHATTTIPYSELTPTGVLQRIENKVSGIPNAVEQSKKKLEQAQKNLKTYKEQAEVPFDYDEQLNKKVEQLAVLEKKLQGQELSPEALATVEDLIAEIPEPELEEVPRYRWGAPQDVEKPEVKQEPFKEEVVEEKPTPELKVPTPAKVAPKKELRVGMEVRMTRDMGELKKGDIVKVKEVNEYNDVWLIKETSPTETTDYGWTREENVEPIDIEIKAPVPPKVEKPLGKPKPIKPRPAKAEKLEKPSTALGGITPTIKVVRLQETRSKKAQAVDAALVAKNVVTINKAEPWLKQPNRYDIAGVDAPKGTKATFLTKASMPKPRKQNQPKGPGLLLPSGKMVRQKRGSVLKG